MEALVSHSLPAWEGAHPSRYCYRTLTHTNAFRRVWSFSWTVCLLESNQTVYQEPQIQFPSGRINNPKCRDMYVSPAWLHPTHQRPQMDAHSGGPSKGHILSLGCRRYHPPFGPQHTSTCSLDLSLLLCLTIWSGVSKSESKTDTATQPVSF